MENSKTISPKTVNERNTNLSERNFSRYDSIAGPSTRLILSVMVYRESTLSLIFWLSKSPADVIIFGIMRPSVAPEATQNNHKVNTFESQNPINVRV